MSQREIPSVRAGSGRGNLTTETLDALAMHANAILAKVLPTVLREGGALNESERRDVGSLGRALGILARELFPGEEEWALEGKVSRRINLAAEGGMGVGVNYFGLLLGPGGASQKRMESESGCKILVKGAPEQPHVLLIGETEAALSKAEELVKAALNSNSDEKAYYERDEADAALSHMLTPYGPPNPDATIYRIPNDIVGLIIGKGGETIRQLQLHSSAKIQVAKSDIPGSSERNVFIEGPPEQTAHAQKLINDIISEHKRTQAAPHRSINYPIPLNLTGMVIGRGGDTLKSLMQRTGAIIEVPKVFNPSTDERVLTLTGSEEVITRAKD